MYVYMTYKFNVASIFVSFLNCGHIKVRKLKKKVFSENKGKFANTLFILKEKKMSELLIFFEVFF